VAATALRFQAGEIERRRGAIREMLSLKNLFGAGKPDAVALCRGFTTGLSLSFVSLSLPFES
jgi:hypothetical protein